MIKRKTVLFLLAILPVAAAPVRRATAAVTLVFERSSGGATTAHTVIADEQHLRVEGLEHEGHGPQIVIYSAAKKTLDMLVPEKKTYHEMTEADAKKMAGQMDAMRAQMAEAMKSMPPEQRKMVEQKMAVAGLDANGPNLEMTWKPLGQKKTVGAWSCDVYEVSLGARVTEQECVAPWSSNIVSKTDLEAMKTLFASMASLLPVGGAAFKRRDWSHHPGIPVETTRPGVAGGPPVVETLKQVKHGAVPASLFEVPAGFTKEAMPELGGRGGHGPFGPGGPGAHHPGAQP